MANFLRPYTGAEQHICHLLQTLLNDVYVYKFENHVISQAEVDNRRSVISKSMKYMHDNKRVRPVKPNFTFIINNQKVFNF